MSARTLLIVACLSLLALPWPAQAIILHNAADAPTGNAKPLDVVLGRWSSNASAVAIGQDGWLSTNFILTTRHQGGGVGTTVTFGGVDYVVAGIWNYLDTELDISTDLRICRLETTAGQDANLSAFVPWAEMPDEENKNIVMGGYGKTRGTQSEEKGVGSYYAWAEESGGTLTWGTNRVDGLDTYEATNSDLLYCDFDDPLSNDAAIAEHDSGGGWFYQDGDDWILAGISAYAGAASSERSYYATSFQYDFLRRNYAIRVSSYASWIDTVVTPEPGTMILLGLGGILLPRLRRRRKV